MSATAGGFKVDDLVGYKSSLGQEGFTYTGRVSSVHPDGIPSCKRPLVMLKGLAGVVLASHCIPIENPKEVPF